MHIKTLDDRQRLDVAEAIMFEPALHGSMTSVDEMLDRWEQVIIEATGSEDAWGTGNAAEQGQRAMMDVFPQAAPRDSEAT